MVEIIGPLGVARRARQRQRLLAAFTLIFAVALAALVGYLR